MIKKEKKNKLFSWKTDMLLKRDDFQLFFEKKFIDHNQFLENVSTPEGWMLWNFPGRPKWTRMNAQIDKRTYFGNIGLI